MPDDRNIEMALPPISSGDGGSAWWQQFALSGVGGLLMGMATALWRTTGMISRISVLESNQESATEHRHRLEEVVKSMSDSQRVQWEKTQQQVWALRADMAQLVTSNQLHSSKEEILSAIRHRQEGG